jgi:hypothetical protein
MVCILSWASVSRIHFLNLRLRVSTVVTLVLES